MNQRCDFYILADNNTIPFTVKLINKAYLSGLRVLVKAANQTDALALDQLLWTFNDTSFIPHALKGSKLAAHAPIIITTEDEDIGDFKPDSIVNLSGNLPKNLENIQRLLEIIPIESGQQQSARDRYKIYRDCGFELHTHKIGEP